MTAQLETWERKHYVPGGGDPFLFYVVYGSVDPSARLSRGKYRSNGPADGIDMMGYGPAKYPEVVAGFREGYLWDTFAKDEPGCAAQIADCDRCVVLRGTPADPTTLDYLRDTVGLVTYMLDNGGRAVYDPLMFRWWSPEA
jgi:hypothetical protein